MAEKHHHAALQFLALFRLGYDVGTNNDNMDVC